MYKIIFSLLFIQCSIAVLAQKHIVNDPDASVRDIDQNFSAITVTDGIYLYLSQAGEAALAVSASNETYKNAIQTKVENGNLEIYFNGKNQTQRNFRNIKLRVYLSFKNLNAIKASDGAVVYLAGNINASSLALNLSDASIFKGTVTVDTLLLHLSDASNASIKGNVISTVIAVADASDVLAYGLVTDVCDIKAAGASDVNITVNKTLNVQASGASTVRYKGSPPIVKKQLKGASSVTKKED